MISAISGYDPYSTYGLYSAAYAGRAAQAQGADSARSVQRPSTTWGLQKASQPEAPVQPVQPARAVGAGDDPAASAMLRYASDPAAVAVRMRIQYPDETAQGSAAQGTEKAQNPALEEAKSAQEVMEEGECQTCKERKYQDGSDDPGVSFKTPTKIAPDQAAAAVRGHENEHVVREQAKARQEGRKVVSQSVTYHTDICPECGKVYVSGGTTRTVTKADNSQQAGTQQQEQSNPRTPYSAVA